MYVRSQSYLISNPSLTLDFSVSLFWGGGEGGKFKKNLKQTKNPLPVRLESGMTSDVHC